MKKILVIENELLIALDLKNILKDQGYDVLFNIVSYEQMLAVIDVYKPDLVLIDIKLLGNKDGIEIAKHLQLNYKMPYIFITSNYCADILRRIKDSFLQPAAFIVKPFRPIDITTTIEIVFNNTINSTIYSTELPLQLKKVVNYIDDNLYNKIELSDLIHLTRWKGQNFSKIFKAHIGTTPYQYIIKRKIDIAKKLLVEEDEGSLFLKDLSTTLRFDSYSNFYNAFVKYAKISPEKFKLKNK